MTWSRSNEKLKILHWAIAKDLQKNLWDIYSINALGFREWQEKDIQWKYMNKKVDITISKSWYPIAGMAIKFVMQNYSQNSNNYFENMLWETANIRCVNIPYFQIFIIPEKLPYYENNGKLKKWESFSEHHVSKYRVLSYDNSNVFFHTPTKTLLTVIKLPEPENSVSNKEEYINFYQNIDINLEYSGALDSSFSQSIIYNDYEIFLQKVVYTILAL